MKYRFVSTHYTFGEKIMDTYENTIKNATLKHVNAANDLIH